MSATLRIAKRLQDGLVLLERSDNRGISEALWDRVRLRKPTTCAVTRRTLPVGSLAYRPITNATYRYERVAAQVIDEQPEPVVHDVVNMRTGRVACCGRRLQELPAHDLQACGSLEVTCK